MVANADPLERDADLLKAIAHPTRLALLETLSQDEECVCHLSYLLDKPQPYVSKQLAELREAGLVQDRRDGMRIFYRLANPRVSSLLEDVRALSGRKALPPAAAALWAARARVVANVFFLH